jgi:hypothetical protein
VESQGRKGGGWEARGLQEREEGKGEEGVEKERRSSEINAGDKKERRVLKNGLGKHKRGNGKKASLKGRATSYKYLPFEFRV